MSARFLLATVLLASGCQYFEPDLAQHGYLECSNDDACAPSGRLCELGYCSPPPWWDKRYKFRRELTVTNPGTLPLPKGFPVTLPVGASPRPVQAGDANALSRIVALDRTLRAQAELPATLENVNNSTGSFDLVFPLPVELPAGATLPGLWLYSAEGGVDPRPDGRDQIDVVNEAFEDADLDPTLWRTEGDATFIPNDGKVLIRRGGYLWSTVSLDGTPGVQLSVTFEVTPPETCSGLTLGLIDNKNRGYDAPYLVASATGNGKLVVEGQPTVTGLPEVVGEIPLSNIEQRLDLRIRGDLASAVLNGEGLEPVTLEEPIRGPLHAHFFVEGGTCTLTVKKVRMRAIAAPDPVVTAGAKVTLPED